MILDFWPKHSAAGLPCGRNHLELRYQSVQRQGSRAHASLRVLRSGGCFAISDIVVRGELPGEIWHRLELCVGCIAGVFEESRYRMKLRMVGFERIEVDPTRIY